MLRLLKRAMQIGPGGVTIWQMLLLMSSAFVTGGFLSLVKIKVGQITWTTVAAGAGLFVASLYWQALFDYWVMRRTFLLLERRGADRAAKVVLFVSMIAPIVWTILFGAACLTLG